MSIESLFKKYADETIKMQYPYDSSGTHKLFDGTIHEIKPREIHKIKLGEREFGVMSYYDVTMKKNAITLLTKIGNTLAKVPLDDYDVLFNYLKANNIMQSQSSFLPISSSRLAQIMDVKEPSVIQLAQTINAEEVLKPSTGPHYAYSSLEESPVYRFKDYVPLEDNGVWKSFNGSFDSPYVIHDGSTSSETYVFTKAPSFAKKSQGIQMGIKDMPIDEYEKYKFVFRTKVEEGDTASVCSVDNKGQVRVQLVFLIPGIHEYTITYAPCRYSEDYKASRCANTMLVKATWPEYGGLPDRKKAFCAGCRRTLPIEFYNADGKKIPDGEKKHTQGGIYK